MWIYYFLVVSLKIEIKLFKTKLFVSFYFLSREFQSDLMDRINEPLLFESGYLLLLFYVYKPFLVLVISKITNNLKYNGISYVHTVFSK